VCDPAVRCGFVVVHRLLSAQFYVHLIPENFRAAVCIRVYSRSFFAIFAFFGGYSFLVIGYRLFGIRAQYAIRAAL
jgi:hypothetical protein